MVLVGTIVTESLLKYDDDDDDGGITHVLD